MITLEKIRSSVFNLCNSKEEIDFKNKKIIYYLNLLIISLSNYTRTQKTYGNSTQQHNLSRRKEEKLASKMKYTTFQKTSKSFD